MTDGERINGDPIIAMGNGKEFDLIATIRKLTGREDASYRDDQILKGFIAYYEKHPKDKQAAALMLTAAGFTQERIAKVLGCGQAYINKLLSLKKSDKQRIANELGIR
jgi:hypothetical protein